MIYTIIDGVNRSFLNNLLSQEMVFVTGTSSAILVFFFTTKVSVEEDILLDVELRKFWELEELPKRNMPSAEEIAQELFT